MPFLPSFNGRLPSWNRLLNAVDGINRIVDISQHIIVRIYVGVFQTHIPIERPHLSDGKWFDGIFILHLSPCILS